MSAELYDAEIAGALARPAIDVLPTQPSRKDKASDVLPGVPLPQPAPPEDIAGDEQPAEAAAPAASDPVAEALQAPEPVAEVGQPEAEPQPRKVFGLPLSRGRRAKPEPEQAFDVGPVEAAPIDVPALEVPAVEVPALAPEVVPAAHASDWDIPTEVAAADAVPVEAVRVEAVPAAAVAEIVPLAPAAADPSEELRALHALLESSEQVREAAEARAAAAESAARTAANGVQEWQIRHREAEATISELAASLAGAEGRMAELREQIATLETERDDLVTQLDTATSPTV